MKQQRLVDKAQKTKFKISNIVHKIYNFFLPNLSAQTQEGTSKIVDVIQVRVIKNNACQNEKWR